MKDIGSTESFERFLSIWTYLVNKEQDMLGYTSHYLSTITVKHNSLSYRFTNSGSVSIQKCKIMRNLPSKLSSKLHCLVPDKILAASNMVNKVLDFIELTY